MKGSMNSNGRKKEARAIFLIMKTLLCVSFCFVVRGRYSNRALLPSRASSAFSPRSSRIHPPATTIAAATALTPNPFRPGARVPSSFFIL